MGIAPINTSIMTMNLEQINHELRGKSAPEIVRWALSLSLRPFVSTSFGPHSAAMLHLVSSIDASVPVVWVDSGYNLKDTYSVAEQLMSMLPLNMHIYTPTVSAERWNAVNGGIPDLEAPELHRSFTEQFKLAPFRRALDDLSPELWLTGIRREDTEYRQTLDVVSWDSGRNMLRVAPIFDWSDDEVEAYILKHRLPTCQHYFDPTKVLTQRECGLHTRL